MTIPARTARRARRAVALVLVLAWSQAASAQAGGIEIFAAETLFDRGTRVSLGEVYTRKRSLFRGTDEIPDPMGRSYDEHRVVAAVSHGFRPDFTLSMRVPYVSKELDSNAGSLDSAGLGDVALLAKWRAYKRDWRRGAFHFAAIGGLELPTGKTDASAGGLRLPPGLQPGLGSWNPIFALAANGDIDRWRFDGLAFYKHNTEGAQSYVMGDFWALELDAAHRFLHTK